MKSGKYRSKFEASIAKFLKDNKVKFEYETLKLKFRAKVRSGVCGTCDGKEVYQNRVYTPDFSLPILGIILESKGRLTASDRTKMTLVKKEHPDLDIRLVFMVDNKLGNKKDERYSDWATANGFPYCVKTIPTDWLSGG